MWRWLGIGVWSFGRVFGFGTEEEVAACSTAGFCFGKVRGVAVDVEVHVAGVVADSSVRMCGTVVQ